jgi:hypothetical protein
MGDINETTTVEELEFDNLADLLGEPGADNIMIPDDGTGAKPNLFSKPAVPDLKFFDKPDKPAADDKPASGDLLNNDPDPKPVGHIAAIDKLIKSGKLLPFDEDKPLDSYTSEDIEDLINANLDEIHSKYSKEVEEGFYSSLPPQLQRAYEYVANGGTDLKGMFSALASAQESFELDIEEERGQEQAIRAYLQATRYGTPEEIEEEIESFKDRGELKKKASQFKPKLDAMQAQIIEQKVQQQEQARQQQMAAARAYQENLYGVLSQGKLNDITLDSKTQDMLYAGLVQPNYPSVTGRPTNMLGHLLEKYQWVEPRHDLIAEALWLLADPDGYKSKIKQQGHAAATEETVRRLKTEQSSRNPSGTVHETDNSQAARPRGISRPTKSFFSR